MNRHVYIESIVHLVYRTHIYTESKICPCFLDDRDRKCRMLWSEMTLQVS